MRNASQYFFLLPEPGIVTSGTPADPPISFPATSYPGITLGTTGQLSSENGITLLFSGMELVGATKRSACGLTFQFTFAVGVILVAFYGWLVPDRFLLQIIYGSHGFFLLGHWWLVDESPRWLWAHGKRDEAIAIVQKGLRVNGNEDLLDVAHFRSQMKPMFKKDTYEEDEEEAGLLSLFKTPNLRSRTFNVGLNW